MRDKDVDDSQVINGLVNRDQLAFKQLYISLYHRIEGYVKANSGDAQNAKDLMQEVFVILIEKIDKGKVNANKIDSLNGYVFQIAKNQWLQVLRQRKRARKGQDGSPRPPEIEQGYTDLEELDIFSFRRQLSLKHFKLLGQTCRDVLEAYYYDEKSMLEIEKQFGYATGFGKQKKHRCMTKLRNLIFKDQEFQKFKNNQ